MQHVTDGALPPAARMSRPLAAIGLAASLGTPLAIDYWIMNVRWVWIEAFPDRAAIRPPTISRAMADVPYGEAVALYLTVAAVLLVVSAASVSILYLRSFDAIAAPARRPRLKALALGIVAIQVPVSLGVILQSVYSLETNNQLHMTGSYMLFIAAGIGQVISISVASAMLRLLAPDPALRRRGLILPGMARVRRVVATVALLCAVVYLALFIGKDFVDSAALYQVYVWTEVALIAFLMAYLMLHAPDFAAILMRRDPDAAASKTPAMPAEGR